MMLDGAVAVKPPAAGWNGRLKNRWSGLNECVIDPVRIIVIALTFVFVVATVNVLPACTTVGTELMTGRVPLNK